MESESSKKFLEKMVNSLHAVNISGSPTVEARWKAEKSIVFTEKLTICRKSLRIYLKSCYYLDEVWLPTYLTSPYEF